MAGTVLIIDDEEQLRKLLSRIIRLEGFDVTEAADLSSAKKMLGINFYEIILCDVKLPDGNGVDFISTIKKISADSEIILLTAHGNIHDGVQAMKNGAFDYIIKGDDNDRIIPILHKAMEKIRMQKRLNQLEKRYSFDSIIGNSPLLTQSIKLAKKVAPTDATVLLIGETGTGKEVFAQAIHTGSKRKEQSFVALNCSSFSKDLLESELFGHKAGAFTGAIKDKKGLMEEAHNGTLFLDEIGEMSFELQSKFLRVLETGVFIKVGETKSSKVNVRIIAATNRNLEQEIKEGRFREDLFYRLNVFTIQLPSLRDRKDDIASLTLFYTKDFAIKTGKKIAPPSVALIKKMEQRAWKGNIRELKNVIERAVILSDKEVLSEELLFPETNSDIPAASMELSEVEKQHIRKVMQYSEGNKTRAAELLGIGLTTLYRKLEEYKLQ